ncbi:MAG: class I SAM-dependent methyltransferase [Bacteroidetes bacterium]|nr:class I SAM-dependent methyltransferase [Bacteroidota bacterium]
MDFLPTVILKYAESHTSKESSLLNRIDRFTYEKMLMPRMLSGHLQGRILSMISKIVQPEKILEIGTFTGYSALCLAEGLAKDGLLVTIDINEELEETVRAFFDESPMGDKIEFMIGDALKIIPELQGEFDMVFIDADKENYVNYYELVFPKLRVGGIIIADNVLWSGKVIEENRKGDKETDGLRIFNRKIQEDRRVENVLFPVRDGLMIIRKK